MLRHEGGFAEETLVRNTDEKLRFGDPDKNRADLYYSWFRLRDLRAGEEETPHGTLYNHPTDRCALKKIIISCIKLVEAVLKNWCLALWWVWETRGTRVCVCLQVWTQTRSTFAHM